MKVLLVDDETSILEQAKVFLEREEGELDIDTAPSAEEALKLLENNAYDGIVSDYQMPQMDGLEFLEVIREDRNSDIPFIIFTGKGREEVAIEALNLGADRYLQKRGNPKSQYGVLADAIVQEVERSKAERGLEERVKELNCLYGISRLAEEYGNSLEDILQGSVELIPPSWQYPEITCARLVVDDEEFRTDNYSESEWKMESDILVGGEKRGFLEVIYLEKRPELDEGPFLKEERDLIEDITRRLGSVIERLEFEEELVESEERYRGLFESAQDGILILDAETGEIKDANPYIQDLLGYSKEELVGKELWEIGTFRDIAENKERFEKLLKEGHVRYEDLPLETKEGEEVPAEFVSNPYETGGEKGVQCNIRDITERKRAEEKLEKARDRAQKYLDIADVIIVAIDRNQEVIEINERGCEVLGYDRDEIIGKNWYENFMPERVRKDVLKDATKPLMNGRVEEGKRYENPIVTRDGEERIISWKNSVIRDDDGETIGILSSGRDITERKKAEERFRSFFMNAGDAIFITDFNGDIMEANPAAADQTGYSHDELVEMNIVDDLRASVGKRENERGEVIEKDEIVRFEETKKRKDGSEYETEVMLTLLDYKGEEAVLSINRDITERKKAEENLKRYKKAVQSSGDSIYMIDRDHRYVFANGEHISRLLDDGKIPSRNKDEVVGRKYAEIHSDEETDALKDNVGRVLEKGKPVTKEYEFNTVDRWSSRTYSPVKDRESGEIEGVIVVSEDITERKKAEEKVRELHETAYKLEGVGSKDEICQIAVDAAEEILEFSFCSIDLLEEGGKLVVKAVSTEVGSGDYWEKYPEEAGIAGETLLNNESYLVDDLHTKEDAEPVKEEYRSAISVPIKDKGVFQAISTETRHFDERDLELAELLMDHVSEALERVQTAEREEFLHSILRHDVRNKAQIIRGYLELLKESDLSEKQEELVEKARRGSENGIDIIEKVRTLREVEEKEKIGEVSVGPVIKNVIGEWESQASEKGISIEHEGVECKVRGGPLLEELFSNLIENSIVHSGCEEIRISSEETEDECIVTVEDGGCGISEEDKDKVFDRGFKKGETGGSGLGLYLVKRIAKGYGGSIEVRDSELGGAKFVVHLERVHV
ncbi:hypothetical protein AKJ51_01855 [candidate division MSBL1 archaeon SCGC-AAA382A20]|uniref:histidine kinase n=1 Tax=candidate division MSBL1 archaeon SCGC-AAA382A20 TaxID=1698280 RepID=A0A133VLA1_9EURY|nr:hypothetical protein AKJ51_01855 [candidate division MSBL1 archaeon SCGC-AAA382A20]